jgi:hypothetical protein
MFVKYLAVGAVVCAALLITAPAGFAQSAAQRGYSTPAGSVQQELGRHDPHASSHHASGDAGTLPFTGLDLGLVAGAGGMLIAIGLAGRRLVGVQSHG